MEMMKEPVMLSSGIIVEKSSYMRANGDVYYNTCPITNVAIERDAYPVASMSHKIKTWKEECLAE